MWSKSLDLIFFIKERKVTVNLVCKDVFSFQVWDAFILEYGQIIFRSGCYDHRLWIAPLPIDFEYDEAQSATAFSMMNMMGGRRAVDNRKLAQAQAIKDATMGWFIARNIKNKFLHINGSYHSNRQGGIIPYLLRYRPNTSIVTVTSVRQESIRKLDDDHKGLADFYICVPDDMVNSY